MATKDQNPARQDGSKRIGSHPRQERLEAHQEAQRLCAHDDTDDEVVPAVTADVDETPGFVKYGAAILLGLAFGVGCYIWVDGGVPSAPQNPGRQLRIAPTEYYFTNAGTYNKPGTQGVLPDPFRSPFEPTLDYEDAGVSVYSTDPEGVEVHALASADARATATTSTTHEATPTVVTVTDGPIVYLFEYDSSEVSENGALTGIADRAKKKGLTLEVRAYTDEHGRVAYNRRLSERRANAVGKYLVAHGVPASKVKVHGMGPTHKYANDAQDRRAEVSVVSNQ
jgi:Outer membrane protein and related peptidoglycan-associated (lipo)proteins